LTCTYFERVPPPLTTTRTITQTYQLCQDAILQVCATQNILDRSPANTSLQNSFFKTLVDHEVTVELKNDIQIRGTLKSVDQYLNIKLDDIQVVEELKYPHLVSN
jgi:small nuclear ribonucleoprotein (snRNP)-like protein